MCISSRLRRSVALSLLTLLASYYIVSHDAPCERTPAPGGRAAAARPSATASPSFGAPPPSPAPRSTPALAICEQPLDVMAPTVRASHSVYPSVRPAPSFSSLDEAMRVARAEALRRHTAQCGSVVSDELADAQPRLAFCEDFPRAVAAGGRAERDAPFATNG